MLDRFGLRYFSTLPEGEPASSVDIDAELSALSVSNSDPIGYNGASIGYREQAQPETAGKLRTPIDVQDLGHVQIWAGSELGYLLFEGRIQDYDQPGGQQVTALTASGYGAEALKDVWVYAPNDTTPLTSGQLVRRVIENAAPLLSIEELHFEDPGGSQIYTMKEQHGRYPNQAIDQIVKAGSDAAQPIVYLVYENRKVRLFPRVPPTDDFGNFLPDYRIPLNRQFVNIKTSGSKLIGACAVQYTPAGGTQGVTETKVDPFFGVRHGGLVKAALITQSTLTADQAVQLRNRYLAKYSQPIARGTIDLGDDFPLIDRNGAAQNWYVCRSGEWVLLGDNLMLEIQAARIDLSGRKTQCTVSNE